MELFGAPQKTLTGDKQKFTFEARQGSIFGTNATEDKNKPKSNIEFVAFDKVIAKSKLSDSQQNIFQTNSLCMCQDISSKLPDFQGESFEEWLKFSNVFTELVHNNTQLATATKLSYLREKTKNKPRTLIAYLLTGPGSNYQLAWETLEKRYGNKRILFTSKLDCLLDMEIMQSDSYESVQKMYDTAKECIYLMKKYLDRDIGESADEIFAHLIMRKMDVSARTQYEQHVRKSKSIQKLKDVMDFLEQQTEIMENVENLKNAGDAESKLTNTEVLETTE